MNYPFWETLTIGGPTLIAAMAVVHVYVSHLAIGGGLYLYLTDRKGVLENDPQIQEYARKYSVFFLLLTGVFGAVTGVGIWFIIGLVSPAATATLIHTFVFAWAIEWVFFIGELASLLIYYYYFHRLQPRLRLNLMLLYFVFAWLSLFVINGIIDFMLTPGGWLETRSFWAGFFNPTMWPALFFRTFITLMLAGLFGYITTVYLERPEFRRRMVRYCTRWLLLPMIGLIPSALWYYGAVPESFRTTAFVLNRDLAQFVHLLLAATVMIFLLGVLLSAARSLRLQRMAALVIIPVGLGWMAGFEYTREIARKPYVIAGYMYSNSILRDQLPQLNREGLLPHARWSAVKAVTPENRLEAGRELFRLQCAGCHTVRGVRNDIVGLIGDLTYRGLIAQLTGQGRVLDYMPPFAGTEAEKEALAAWLTVGLLGRELPEGERFDPAAAPALETAPDSLLDRGPADDLPEHFDPENDRYVLLAWNDLGMHCVSDCDSMFSFLPPANTLEAQLIRRGPRPELVSAGVRISYAAPEGHADPAAQLDFWDFAEPLYGVKLERNIGLAGKGLAGVFDPLPEEGIYRARFIPVAPYRADGRYDPYPVFAVEARDSVSNELLARTRVVAPVSTEADCYRCHGGEPRWKGAAGISNLTAANILRAHDKNHGTELLEQARAGQPRLCQSCHADPALGAEGKPGVLNFSAAMHGWHANYMSGLDDRTCAMCHPIAFNGLTRCLRGVHGAAPEPIHCSRCHGTLEDLALSLLAGERDQPIAGRLTANVTPALGRQCRRGPAPHSLAAGAGLFRLPPGLPAAGPGRSRLQPLERGAGAAVPGLPRQCRAQVYRLPRPDPRDLSGAEPLPPPAGCAPAAAVPGRALRDRGRHELRGLPCAADGVPAPPRQHGADGPGAGRAVIRREMLPIRR